MRSGAFDVAFGGTLKIKHLSYTTKTASKGGPGGVRQAAKKLDEPVVEVAPPLSTATANAAAAGVRACVVAVCCLLALHSVYSTIPYMGTLVNIITLELVPVSALLADASNPHVAILATGACISLFFCVDALRQSFLTYPTYICMALVLVLLVAASPRLRPTDSLLVAFTVMAMLSALLLRYVAAGQQRVVQTVELVLLVLYGGTYGFMLHRTGTPVIQSVMA